MSAGPMSAIEVRLPFGRPLTWDDLQSIPDDQYHAYELFDGKLVVSPSPDYPHQLVVANLHLLLHAARPSGAVVLTSPYDVVPRPTVTLQPDLLVLCAGERRRDVPPLLVVEVASPSTGVVDRTVKRAYYAEFGVPAYWIVDPVEPALLALRLVGGDYVEAGRVQGEQAYDAVEPFPVHVVPARLLDE